MVEFNFEKQYIMKYNEALHLLSVKEQTVTFRYLVKIQWNDSYNSLKYKEMPLSN